MKKFFLMFAMAAALVACNNSSDGTGSGDSLNKAGDSLNSGSGSTSGGSGDSLNQINNANSNDSLNRNTNDSLNKPGRDSAGTK